MFGKKLSEYISFAKPILLLILVVGIARLALSLAGVQNSAVKWLSISVTLLIGLVYFSIRVYTTGFGSYKQLLPVLYLQAIVSQAIVIAGIVIAIETHKDNIFSAPEYSGGGDGKTWVHVAAHFIVMIISPLVAWLVGSAIMWVTKKVAPRGSAPAPQNA